MFFIIDIKSIDLKYRKQLLGKGKPAFVCCILSYTVLLITSLVILTGCKKDDPNLSSKEKMIQGRWKIIETFMNDKEKTTDPGISDIDHYLFSIEKYIHGPTAIVGYFYYVSIWDKKDSVLCSTEFELLGSEQNTLLIWPCKDSALFVPGLIIGRNVKINGAYIGEQWEILGYDNNDLFVKLIYNNDVYVSHLKKK